MKIKTSLVVTAGCFFIFLFLMLPVFLSMKEKKEQTIKSFKGSSFSLKDVNNKNITEKSFEGPLTAIFFGFTNCPDICPMTLNNLDLVISDLPKRKKEMFKVFFVSIDPKRDSTEVIKNYLESFDNKIFGITGDPKKVFLLSQSWGVLSEKIFTEDGNYLINHSSSVLLLRDGKYLDRISHHASQKDMFSKINRLLR
jgi:protein SCO1/2|tara:strand:- start:1877 stop:2467 length:591 start_codon:yes stop_codon:yes gene_type:complete